MEQKDNIVKNIQEPAEPEHSEPEQTNFTNDGEAGGTHWTGERDKGQEIPNEMKTRWVRWLEPPKKEK
jgi:hypothetical protein